MPNKLGPVKDILTDEEIESGLRTIVRDGMATEAVITFTGGAFLIAFALQLGASNLMIGLLAGIPPLMHLLQVPSIYVVQKLRRRRLICTATIFLARLSWLGAALIPFLVPGPAGLVLFLALLVSNAAFGSLAQCSWNSWMRDFVPQDRLGAFYSRRMRWMVGVGIVLSLAAGVFLDLWSGWAPGREVYGYSALFGAGFAAGMLGVYFLSTIPEPRMSPANGGLLRSIATPFREENFRRLIAFLGLWNFGVNLAAPFFTVYMLKRLNMEMSQVIGLLVLSQLTNFAFMSLWGPLSDRFSSKSVLGVCAPIFILCIFLWTFTTLPDRYFLTVPLLIVIHVFTGISTAGTSLASTTIGLKLAPKGEATPYLAAASMVNNVAAGLAPVLGGLFADFFARREFSMTLNWRSPGVELHVTTLSFQHWDFFFLLAFLLGLISLHFLTKVREVGEVEERIVVHMLVAEVWKSIRNFSTAGGLRLLQFVPTTMAGLTKGQGETGHRGLGEEFFFL